MTRTARRPACASALGAALALALVVPGTAAAQGVRGGADSVKVRVAGVERIGREAGTSDALLEVRVALDHARGFHSWPDEPVVPPELAGLNPIATAIEVVSLPEGAALEEIAWPDPVPVTVRYSAEPLELLSFLDTTVARVRIRVPGSGLPPDARAGLRVTLQSCDEEYCYPPRRVSLEAPLAPATGDH